MEGSIVPGECLNTSGYVEGQGSSGGDGAVQIYELLQGAGWVDGCGRSDMPVADLKKELTRRMAERFPEKRLPAGVAKELKTTLLALREHYDGRVRGLLAGFRVSVTRILNSVGDGAETAGDKDGSQERAD